MTFIHSAQQAILHVDADAFFASCEQARDPRLRGLPVITGKERGIASSMSYEAKALGVTRGMPLHEIRALCPDAIVLPSDYETYSLLSKRLFGIVRRFTPDVEEYSIDECFADLTGLRRMHRKPYSGIAADIKHVLDTELGVTFSVGLAPTKVLAKIGSKWKKPSGLTVIGHRAIGEFLRELPAEKVWGIGPQTAAFLAKHGIATAGRFAAAPFSWVRANLTKPHQEIWHELNGTCVMPVNTAPKESYASVQKMKTFTPPSTDRAFVLAQLSKNLENACIKARRYGLAARGMVVFLRTQTFHDRGIEVSLARPSAFPSELMGPATKAFDTLFRPGVPYRATGVMLTGLRTDDDSQPDLFGAHERTDTLRRIFAGVDAVGAKYGKHAVFLGSSFHAHAFGQHLGDRGDAPQRKDDLFKGENGRRRLALPMFNGKIL